MRIVAGRHKGRALAAPPGHDIRPTSDRAREAVFNILVHGFADFEIEGATVVDVFAGTGAMGLEAMSRGAVRTTFIDSDARAQRCIKENAAKLGEWRNVLVLGLDASRLPPPPRPARAPCTLGFLDAPYGQGLTQPALLALSHRGWLADGSLCVVEIGAGETLEAPRAYETLDTRTYGAAEIRFLRHGKA